MDTSALRRSALYVPAASRKLIDKAGGLPCDVVILDLEDSVAPDAKPLARELAVEAARTGKFCAREVVIRVNSAESPWGREDLEAVCKSGANAVLVPKVDGPEELLGYRSAIESAPGLSLWAMVETPASLFRLPDIVATASRTRLSVLVMGTNDLSKELGTQPAGSRRSLHWALSVCVAAARAGGVGVLDGVYNNFTDSEGFSRECLEAVEFGFDGKTVIHPSQIDACNRAFAPSEPALAEALQLIQAFERPENQGKGAIRFNGAMVEHLHLARARRMLALQAAISSGPSGRRQDTSKGD
jgi:citrate lyase subunit beta/citryl-CoA lyase